MRDFKEIYTNKNQIAYTNDKLVYGVGINDANYLVQTQVDGKRTRCPFYTRWKKMLARCYSASYQQKNPTRKDDSVIQQWLKFSNFKAWMQNQDWQGKQLNKNLLRPNNKIYSPENCCFLDKATQAIITEHSKIIGGVYPQGVSFDKKTTKFKAYNKKTCIGIFDTPEEASQAYRKFKTKLILDAAEKQTDIRIKKGLQGHADIL